MAASGRICGGGAAHALVAMAITVGCESPNCSAWEHKGKSEKETKKPKKASLTSNALVISIAVDLGNIAQKEYSMATTNRKKVLVAANVAVTGLIALANV